MEDQGEKVDGAQIAANILLKMPEEARGRIIRRMEAVSRKDAGRVSEKMGVLNLLLEVAPRELENGLRRLADEIIAIALIPEAENIRQHVFNHISPRRRAGIEDLIKSLPPSHPRVVKQAKQMVLDSLKSGGLVGVG